MTETTHADRLQVYTIWDTVDEIYWRSPKGKMTWLSSGAAKNAVNANPPHWLMDHDSSWRHTNFSKQSRMVVRKGIFTLANSEVVK